jgi:GT2 family glycosyltransferase
MTSDQQTDNPAWPEPAAADGPVWRRFDADWYACAHARHLADAGTASAAALLRHYHAEGAAMGLSPNPYFDEAWYLARYPDVAGAIVTGLVTSGFDHYCRDGFRDRAAHWLFDVATYLDRGRATQAEIEAAGAANAYDHFLRVGARENRACHLLFDAATYAAGLEDEPGAAAAIAAMGAWHHFLARAWFEGREAVTTRLFDPDWFLARHPAAAARVAARTACCALHAYLSPDADEVLDPLPQFDEAWYLANNPDVAAEVTAKRLASGFEHFLRFGAAKLRAPAPGIDLQRYVERRADVRLALALGESRDAFHHLLAAGLDAAPRGDGTDEDAVRIVAGGHVDSHGYAVLAEGWAFVGWLPVGVLQSETPGGAAFEAGALEAATELAFVARFARGERRGIATVVGFPRPDVAPVGRGALIFLPCPPEPTEGEGLGPLVEVELVGERAVLRTSARVASPALDDRAMVGNAQTALAAATAATGPAVARLRTLLARKPFTGANTLAELRDRVFLEVDEVVTCPPLPGEARAGLVLCGWLLEPPGTIARLRVVSGGVSREVDMARALRLDRHDVLESVGHRHGLPDLRSGYLAYVAEAVLPDEAGYLEVTTARGETAYRPLPAPKLRGMEAIRFLLDRTELRYGEVAPAFDHVYGPAVMRLNADRLRGVQAPQVIDFGPQPAAPDLSVIVTLYGRLDFVEFQLAFLSRHEAARPFELIYVLDDPPKRRQLEQLAASAFARFRIPFRLVLLPRNLGFAPANNVGLAHARAPFVCFMNSDVFPGADDWKERLVDRLRETPDLGAVGPLLLYEDGCVQHQGMNFDRLPAFANWHFPMHPGKGWRPRETAGLHRALAITGACVVMERAVAEAVGGFDPGFPVGDFEDSDLCLKLRARGLDSAVDAGVPMYHLERQSQAGSEHCWRMNLTLYNAWLHESRWQATLEAADQELIGPRGP